jgi:hypothetical protein
MPPTIGLIYVLKLIDMKTVRLTEPEEMKEYKRRVAFYGHNEIFSYVNVNEIYVQFFGIQTFNSRVLRGESEHFFL